MAFSINFNSEATGALSILQNTSQELAETQSRISSGLRVASARDDASTFSIAQGLRSTIQSQNTISQSIALGQSTLSVATAAITNIDESINSIRDRVIQAQSENVDRTALQADINELVTQIESQVQAANFNGANLLNDITGSGTFSVLTGINSGVGDPLIVQRANLTTQGAISNSVALDTFGSTGPGQATLTLENVFSGTGTSNPEIDSITIQVTDPNTSNNPNGESTTFTVDTRGATDFTNLASLVQGALQGVDGAAGLFDDATVQDDPVGRTLTFSGGTSSEDIQFDAISVNFSGGGLAALRNINVDGTGSTGDSDRSAALAAVDTAQDTVRTVDARFGSNQSRLDQQGNFINSLIDSLESGLSSLVDADLTEESVNLSRLQTQQQLGFQTLSIAGQQTQALLGLFR